MSTHATHDARQVQRNLAQLGRAMPDTMSAFARLHGSATADGVLSGSVKELIALAMAVGQGCEGCIAYHADRALAAGATREEAIEALGVAVVMGGGPAAVHAADALAQLESVIAA